MNIHSATASALMLFLIGCNETNDPDVLPYEERLVVFAYLNGGGRSPNVRFWRTLPLDQQNAGPSGPLTGVSGAIIHEGTEFPLQELPGSPVTYGAACSLIAGERYALEAHWRGHSIHASTRIPPVPVIDTLSVNVDAFQTRCEAVIVPRPSEVYFATWFVEDVSGRTVFSQSSSGLRLEDAGGDGLFHLRMVTGEDSLLRVSLSVTAYDIPYYSYLQSRGNLLEEILPTYSYFSGPVTWNVLGDGVGLFIGQTSTTTSKLIGQ